MEIVRCQNILELDPHSRSVVSEVSDESQTQGIYDPLDRKDAAVEIDSTENSFDRISHRPRRDDSPLSWVGDHVLL